MEKSTVLAALTFVTLCSGLAVAAYQLWVTEDAKKTGLGGPNLNRPTGTTATKDGVRADAHHTNAAGSAVNTENQPT